MGKEEVKKMLDDMVDSLETLAKYEKFIVSNIEELHVGNGFIRNVASVMELNVQERPFNCNEPICTSVATEIWFTYRGIRFFELENWRMIDGAKRH